VEIDLVAFASLLLFGTPLGAIAAAAGAVSIPIIIHLLNRRRFRIVSWAAMRFLLAAQRKNSRRLRLEQLILLAVRCLVVVLVLLAMVSVMPWAETAWQRLFPDSVSLTVTGAHRTHKILVVDGSFSMAVKLGDGTAFDRAKVLAEQIVRESPRGDGFSVVLMSASPRRIVPEPSEDAPRVNKEIQALRLPHGNADLPGTLNTIESLLRRSPGKFEEHEVYFLTDLQQSTWILKQPGLVSAVLQKIQARARTIFVDVGQDGIGNLAVTRLGLGAPLATVGAVMPIAVTVHNFSSEARDSVRLELCVGKARAAAADPPLEMRVAQQIVVRANRGPNFFSFPYRFTTPGEYVLQVRLESDALELDDARSAVLTVKPSVPVMVVDGKPAARESFDSGAEWLRVALNPFDSKTTPASVPFRAKVLNESQFADASLGDLTDYDCVFFCDVARLSPPEVRRLETHLRRGGGAVFSLGDHVDAGAYNDLLFRGGQGLLPARLLKKISAPGNVHFHLAVEGSAYQEPPLEAFADDNDRLSLLMARFQRYFQVVPVDRAGPRKVLSFMPISVSASSKGSPIEGLPIGDPALLEWHPPSSPLPGDESTEARDRGQEPARYRGRVVLVTSTLNGDWTSWPASPSYLPLIQELARFAVSGRLREQAVSVGEPLEEFLPSGGTALDASLTNPEGRNETVRTLALEDSSLLRWPDTELSGLYRVVVGHHPQEHLFAVNVPSATLAEQGSESDLIRASSDELRRSYPEWDFQVVSTVRDVKRSGGPTAGPLLAPRPLGPGLARWLLLAALVLLLAEVLLAWRFGHFSTLPVKATRPTSGLWLPGIAAAVVFLTLLILGGVLVSAANTGDFLGFLPERLRLTLETALNIAPPAPGEGSRWRLEFQPYFWDAAADPWLAGLFAVLAGASVYGIYRREGRALKLARGYPLLLVALRVCLLLLTLTVLLPQLQLWFERQGWPDVVVLIDDSHSMSTVDHWQDVRVKALAEQLGREASLAQLERLRLAQALLTRPGQDWLTALLTQRKTRVHVYHCATRAARLSDVTEPGQVSAALQAIQNLRADPANDSSQLGSALRQVLNDFRGSSLSAVIMLTDGVTTEGEDLARVARYAAQVGVPLFFIGLGEAHEARDLCLHDLQAEDSVYVNDRLVIEVRLSSQGISELNVPVRLFEKGKDRVLLERMVRVNPQGKPVKVRLVHQPQEEGEKVYLVKVPVQEGEANTANNVIERTVHVHKTRLIKVLYVEGEARWEYRYVKNLLERESNRLEGNKSIDLKVLLLDADSDWGTQDRSAVSEFPARSELNQYDVVILGDVNPRPGTRTPKMTEHLQNLADFVKERGGGLLMIAGPQYAPHAYKGTPLQDVLPIDVLTDQQDPEPDAGREASYRPQLTPVGQLHPIFRFSPDEKENGEIWNGLKKMFWFSEGYQPKRAAEVLATLPSGEGRGTSSEQTTGSSLAPHPSPLATHPLVVQQFVGAGRSLFFGFDETWRWRWREDELRFNQFWVQTVRYLARSRTGRVALRLDRQTPYRRGEPIRVMVRFPDDAPPPPPDTEVKVVVERREKGGNPTDPEVQTMHLAKVEGSRSSFEGLLTRTPEGEYQFWLSAPSVSGTRPRTECRVLAPPGEMEVLRLNQAEMERAAEETQGRFYTLADAEHLLSELPAGTRVNLNASGPPLALWNHVLVFALVLTLLGLEWVLRKRQHLL
jgi:hypothetical protein